MVTNETGLVHERQEVQDTCPLRHYNNCQSLRIFSGCGSMNIVKHSLSFPRLWLLQTGWYTTPKKRHKMIEKNTNCDITNTFSTAGSGQVCGHFNAYKIEAMLLRTDAKLSDYFKYLLGRLLLRIDTRFSCCCQHECLISWLETSAWNHKKEFTH